MVSVLLLQVAILAAITLVVGTSEETLAMEITIAALAVEVAALAVIKTT